MNLLEYFDHLENELQKLSKQELISLITEQARSYSKKQYDNLLEDIKNLNINSIETEARTWTEQHRKQSKIIDAIIGEIENGNICIIQKEDYEDYISGGYNWYDDPPTYIDDREIIKNLEEIFDFFETLMRDHYYYRAYELGKKILKLKITFDFEDYYIEENKLPWYIQNNTLNIDFNSLVLKILKAAFLQNGNNIDRSKTIFQLFTLIGFIPVSFEQLFSVLPISVEDYKKFLKCFISEIGLFNLDLADQLIAEAKELLNEK